VRTSKSYIESCEPLALAKGIAVLRLGSKALADTSLDKGKERIATLSCPDLGFLVALLTLMLVAGSGRGATVTIDGSQTYQIIDGFGVNANHRSWNPQELPPVLDALIDRAGMTLFHVIFDNNNWESNNDNGDPNIMNWAYYDSVYSAPEFQKLWGIMAYLNQRGITNGLVPELQGPVPLWMGGLSLTPGYENEYAETIASLLVYARYTQHLQFSAVGPINEPDTVLSGINLSGPDQYITVMHDLTQQLDHSGLSDVRFSGPDLAGTSTAWLGAMMNDPVVMSKLARFGLHSYLGMSADATGVYDFIRQSAYPERHFWMTEFNVWCGNCQASVSGDNSWDYARGTATCLLNHLANGASAGLVWEGYDSQYVDFNPTTGGNNPPHWSYWGLLAVDNPNAAVKTYTPRKGFYTLAQIARFVRPSAQRIDVSGPTAPLTVLAFYNTNNGQFTLTGVNADSSPTTLSGTLTNLPSVSSLELYYTDSTNNLVQSDTVPVTDGSFSVSVPPDSVFTLATSNSNLALPAIVLTSPANDASFAAPATVRLAAGVTANGHSITGVGFYNDTTLLGEATNAPYTFTWSSVPAGTYRLTARLVYDAGSTLSSTAVNMTITNSPPPPTNVFFFGPPLTPVWDISGTYGITNHTQGATLQPTAIVFKDVALVVDARGHLQGGGTAAVLVAEDSFAGDYRLTGTVTGGGTATRVNFSLKFKGTGAISGIPTDCSISARHSLEVNPTDLTLVGKSSGSVHFSKGGSGSLKSDVALPLPSGADGGWSVILDVHPAGTKLSGTAAVVVHNSSALATKVTGSMPRRSTTTKVTLSGSGPSAGTRINLQLTPTSGASNLLPTLTGKVLGQKVRS
jgi:O-glycosyl hydrolase